MCSIKHKGVRQQPSVLQAELVSADDRESFMFLVNRLQDVPCGFMSLRPAAERWQVNAAFEQQHSERFKFHMITSAAARLLLFRKKQR